MFAAGEDVFPFSGDVIIRYGFPVFVDDKPLFVRLKGIGPLFNEAGGFFFFFINIFIIIMFLKIGKSGTAR